MNKEIEIIVNGKPIKMNLPPDLQDSKIVIEDDKVFVETGVVDYINNLKFKNKELKEENQRLKERIEYLERSNNRREDTIISLRDEITEQKDYENILNELEKWVYQFREEHKNDTGIFDKFLTTREVLDKLNELKESDK